MVHFFAWWHIKHRVLINVLYGTEGEDEDIYKKKTRICIRNLLSRSPLVANILNQVVNNCNFIWIIDSYSRQ